MVISPRFADAFGQGDVRAEPRYAVSIADALVQQYRRFPEAFENAMESALPEELVLQQEAEERDIPLATLVYGISAGMANAFTVGTGTELSLLLRAGEFEPHVLEALLKENDGKPLSATMFRQSTQRDAYALRAHFCAAFLGPDSAYALLQAGVIPMADFTNIQKVIDCIILGVDTSYAVATKGCIDPPEVVKAYRDGVPVEYLMGAQLSPMGNSRP